MVSLIGYSIDTYVSQILLSYGLLILLAIVRFWVERDPTVRWKYGKEGWVEVEYVQHLYLIPLIGFLLLFWIYATDIRLGTVMAINGAVAALIAAQVSKRYS